MEKEKEVKKEEKKKKYTKPEVKKHENLKDVTLLSFNPPG